MNSSSCHNDIHDSLTPYKLVGCFEFPFQNNKSSISIVLSSLVKCIMTWFDSFFILFCLFASLDRMMTKHAQNRRKRFGRRNFKQRYFRLTTQSLSYSKAKGKRPICDIPLTDLVAVEKLEERSFKMQNIFRVSSMSTTTRLTYAHKFFLSTTSHESLPNIRQICTFIPPHFSINTPARRRISD